jgi:transmembrane sensor
MNKEELDLLFERYLQGKCNTEEIAQVEYLLDAYDNEMDNWGHLDDDSRKTFLSTLYLQIRESISSYEQRAFQVRNKFKIYPLYIAASILLCLSIAIYFYQSGKGMRLQELELATRWVKPGSNKAVLTFADGRTINLNDAKNTVVADAGKLSYDDGTAVGAEGLPASGLQISTPRGGTYSVVLADGTKVWLNASTTLKFPASFAGLTNRKVSLIGEAYFEVAKDKKIPFVVQSKGQEVEVLGTHFNINCYPDEGNVKTTLLEGLVKVKAGSGNLGLTSVKNEKLLKPNQQAVLMGNYPIKILEVDPTEAVSWKNGQFTFKSESLGTIMRKIERWYNVDMIYQDDLKDLKLTGTISRFENVAGVFKMLEATGEVHFKAEGGKIIIYK